MTDSPDSQPHWGYLLALDEDLVRLSRYVEFHERNYETFSIELARVLLAAASEVDVVAKRLCRSLVPLSVADGINAYRPIITGAYPSLPDFEVDLQRFGLLLRPWAEWSSDKGVPEWWTAHNKVKHERDTHFGRASLKNTLDAVAGLFVLLLYLFRDQARQGELVPDPQLLRVTRTHYGGVHIGSADSHVCYALEEPVDPSHA